MRFCNLDFSHKVSWNFNSSTPHHTGRQHCLTVCSVRSLAFSVRLHLRLLAFQHGIRDVSANSDVDMVDDGALQRGRIARVLATVLCVSGWAGVV